MKILTAQQFAALSAETLKAQSISEVDLVKRAGSILADALISQFQTPALFYFFCGTGKNGADGLECAKKLQQQGNTCCIFIVNTTESKSPVFLTILNSLEGAELAVNYVNSETSFPQVPPEAIIIDALVGTGLNKAVTGLLQTAIEKINSSKVKEVISVDLPSGLSTNGPNLSDTILMADKTMTLELPKLNLFLADNYRYVGDWMILKIGLDEESLENINTDYEYIDSYIIESIANKLRRTKYAHKGNFGHTLFIGGMKGKIGAAILSTKASLRSGAGLSTAYVPACGYVPVQTALPEAMVLTDKNPDFITSLDMDFNQYSSIAVGPGLGVEEQTAQALKLLLQKVNIPVVLDADALNIIAGEIETIPKDSILTPHIREFERLVGPSLHSNDRLEKQLNFSVRYKQVVILKGAHTSITLPDGRVFFNSTGNPGMATAGSGDVLTGVIAGLLAQGLDSYEAAILGVFMHGLAGDLASKDFGEVGMTSLDIIDYLPKALMSFIP